MRERNSQNTMEVAVMPNYVEILRLYEAGFSLRQIGYVALKEPSHRTLLNHYCQYGAAGSIPSSGFTIKIV